MGLRNPTSGGIPSIDSVLAGAGLTGSGTVLAVGAGAGISVAADSVALDLTYAPTWTGVHTFQRNAIGTTTAPETDAGVAAVNATAATVSVLQDAPPLYFKGSGWNTTTVATHTIEGALVFVASSAASGIRHGTFQWRIKEANIASGAWTTYLTLSSAGTLNINSGTLSFGASAQSITDPNGNEYIKWVATVSSAINEITIANAAASSSPSITATGGDTDIGLILSAKGA